MASRWVVAGTPGSSPYPCRCLHPFPKWPHKGRKPKNPMSWCECWLRTGGDLIPIEFCCARPENARGVSA